MYIRSITKRYLTVALLMIGILFASESNDVLAQQAGDREPVAVSKANQSDIIDSLSEALNDIYVFPDVALDMEKTLRKNFKKGKYKKLASLEEFTQALNEDLQKVSHDLHLGVRPMDAATYAAMLEENPEEQEEFQRRDMDRRRRSNFGFKKLEILPGNIGYMDLRGFNHASFAGATAVAAMNFLSNSDALILDLRQNGGGSPRMIQLLTSYLLEDPTHINSFYVRKDDSIQQFWTSAHVEGPKMVETPVYVLTSRQTFSAAEEFTYNLKNLKRATIVGETTGGGAHPVESHFFRISDEVFFQMQLPFGRAISPITGTNWEGTGVEPDIEAPADQALDVALLDALKKIAKNSNDEEHKASLQWAIKGLEFKNNPVDLDEKAETLYTGTFGPRMISFEDGTLFYQRAGRAKYKMTPMGDDLFAIDGLDFFRIQFVRDLDGTVNKLIGNYEGGRTDSNVRTQS